MGKKVGYTSELVRIKDWKPRSRQPRLMLAQLIADFTHPKKTSGQFRLDSSPEYVAKLLGVIDTFRDFDADILVYPEFAWPLGALDQALKRIGDNLPDHTLCVLPVEHLWLSELEELLKKLPLARDTLAETILREIKAAATRAQNSSAVVNVAVSVVKVNGKLKAVVQPKLRPAGLESELGGRFAGGRTRFVLAGDGIRVATAICFDFIARDEASNTRPRDAVAKEKLDLLLVPECNPSPFHSSYALGAIDLYEESVWAQANPIIAFANLARGSTRYGLSPEFFPGLSRVIGKLGLTTPALKNVFHLVDGVVADRSLQTLDALEKSQTTQHPTVKSLVLRPQESLMVVRIPTLRSGPTKDVTVERINTEVTVCRSAGQGSERWIPIRSTYTPSKTTTPHVPLEHVVEAGLVGSSELEVAFIKELREASSTFWIVGDGGGGKTALVATILHREFSRTFRIAWLDLARIGDSDEALEEHVLLALDLAGALKETREERTKAIAQAMLRTPTFLVLDSYERGRQEQPVPPWLIDAARWPSRLIVTSRQAPPDSSSRVLRVAPLTKAQAKSLLSREAAREIDDALAESFYACTRGSPLGCTWIGRFLRVGGVAPKVVAEGLTENSEADLRALFEYVSKTLQPLEREILSVLCDLPEEISSKDLADILGRVPTEIDVAVDRLRSLNLVMTETGSSRLHTRHPFVRQFWKIGDQFGRILSWADRLIASRGGDRRWREYSHLASRWTNLRHILDRLPSEGPDASTFLRLWRGVDYFLWSSGRWRDRIELGEKAAKAAAVGGDKAAQAHALFDSIAETKSHRRSTPDEVAGLLNEAEALYHQLGDDKGRAMVAYYRGRIARDANELEKALQYANTSVELARGTKDQETLGLTLNGLANVHRDQGDLPKAFELYDEAIRQFRETQDEEMIAVVSRNQARCHLKRSEFAQAITKTEEAMQIFQALDLQVEQAEAANYHARALAHVGDHDEALLEYEAARQVLEPIGSSKRGRELKETKAAIDALRKT